LVRDGREYVLEAHVAERWKALYRFSEERQEPSDYEVANWYTSTHPDSIFRRSLMAARATRDARFALLDGRLSIHHGNGSSEQRALLNGPAIRRTLTETFRIRLPESADLDGVLERLTQRT
jgi:N-hydroxyarylamine O-acetyltransferase